MITLLAAILFAHSAFAGDESGWQVCIPDSYLQSIDRVNDTISIVDTRREGYVESDWLNCMANFEANPSDSFSENACGTP